MIRTSITRLVVFVLIAGAATAWLFGRIAGQGYAMPFYPQRDSSVAPIVVIGEWWGAFTGLVAGAIWCRILVPRAMRAPQRRWAVAGALAGVAVGLLSTVLLHAVLISVSGLVKPMVLEIGLACGASAGLSVGAICGALCGSAARRAQRELDPIDEAEPR